jgi:hypothetical protein
VSVPSRRRPNKMGAGCPTFEGNAGTDGTFTLFLPISPIIIKSPSGQAGLYELPVSTLPIQATLLLPNLCKLGGHHFPDISLDLKPSQLRALRVSRFSKGGSLASARWDSDYRGRRVIFVAFIPVVQHSCLSK